MNIRIEPRMLSGSVTPPPSKSLSHRLLISAALADGVSTIRNLALSEDIEATLRCISALGGQWKPCGNGSVRIRGINRAALKPDGLPGFDCGESGSTLRFFLPLSLALTGGGSFTGRGRLMARPQQPYRELFSEQGIRWEQEADTLTVSGRLHSGCFSIPGNISSQFFTGLLFALPLLDGESRLTSSTQPESADYIAMTLAVLRAAGISVQPEPDGRSFRIPSAQYQPLEQTVEADWSQAAFWYAAKHLGAALTVTGTDPSSVQGDRVIAPLSAELRRSGEATIDLSPCPDLLPPLAVMAAVRDGTTRFVNAARLRLKESDRLHTVCTLLRSLGGQAEEGADSLTVCGLPRLHGGTVDGANDHRIVMAAAVAACVCTSEVTILGAEAVRKSFPHFFRDYLRLGGKLHVL